MKQQVCALLCAALLAMGAGALAQTATYVFPYEGFRYTQREDETVLTQTNLSEHEELLKSLGTSSEAVLASYVASGIVMEVIPNDGGQIAVSVTDAGKFGDVKDMDELTQEQRQQLLRSTNEDAQWLIHIVENLLSITRIGAGEDAQVTKTPEAAEEVIEGAVGKFRRRYPQIDVRVELPEEFFLVPMDPLLIEQVLVNLMENAVIHGETHRIDVMLRREGDNAVFEVSDDGKGIPLSLLPRLFDGAARSDRRSDGKRSMGIGLSVCRTVVQAHGGTIRGDNKREGGACFTVTLPMKGDDNEDQG